MEPHTGVVCVHQSEWLDEILGPVLLFRFLALLELFPPACSLIDFFRYT
jgi:hypothetical protein